MIVPVEPTLEDVFLALSVKNQERRMEEAEGQGIRTRYCYLNGRLF
jgi:hypothetical protein